MANQRLDLFNLLFRVNGNPDDPEMNRIVYESI